MSLGQALLDNDEDQEIKYYLRVNQATRALCEDSFAASKFCSFVFLILYVVVGIVVAVGQQEVTNQAWVTSSQFKQYDLLNKVQGPEDFMVWLRDHWVPWTFSGWTAADDGTAIGLFGHNNGNLLVLEPSLETYRVDPKGDDLGNILRHPPTWGGPNNDKYKTLPSDAQHPYDYGLYTFHMPGRDSVFPAKGNGIEVPLLNDPAVVPPPGVGVVQNRTALIKTIQDAIDDNFDFLDEETAVIILNVVSLNRIKNVVCAGRWVLDMLPGGTFEISDSRKTYHPNIYQFGKSLQCRRNGFYTRSYDFFRLFCELVFLAMSVMFCLNIVKKELKLLRAHGTWVAVLTPDNLLITLFDGAIFALSMFLTIDWVINVAVLTKLPEGITAFYDLDYDMKLEKSMDIFRLAVGVFLFFLTFRVIRTMTFSERVAILANTLAGASKPLLFFCIVFFIVIGGYAMVGFYYYGPLLANYRDISTALATTLLMATQENIQYTAMSEVGFGFSAVYYFSFAFIVTFILINIFLAIVMAAYEQMTGESVVKHSHRSVFATLTSPFQNKLLERFEEQEWIARVSRHQVPCNTRVWLRKHKLWLNLSFWLYGDKLSQVKYVWICTPAVVRLKEGADDDDDDDDDDELFGGDGLGGIGEYDSDDSDSKKKKKGGGGNDTVVLEVFTDQYSPSYQCQLVRKCGTSMKFRLPPELLSQMQQQRKTTSLLGKMSSTDKLTLILHRVWPDVSPHTTCKVYFSQGGDADQMVLNLGDAMDFWTYPYVIARDDIPLHQSLSSIELADKKLGLLGYTWTQVKAYLEDEHSQRDEFSFFGDGFGD